MEHKPGAKIGFEDYLSKHPISDAKPVSTYDSMFTVAKISQIRYALGFKKKISPKVNSSLQRPIMINAFLIYWIEKIR